MPSKDDRQEPQGFEVLDDFFKKEEEKYRAWVKSDETYKDVCNQYEEAGYRVFRNFDYLNHHVFFVAIKPMHTISYVAVPLPDVESSDPDRLLKAFKREFFYSGRFRELLYCDRKHQAVKYGTNISFCSIVKQNVYDDMVVILEEITKKVGQELHLLSFPSFGAGLDKKFKEYWKDDNDHKIQGAAGTGKTFGLAYMAAKYAERYPERRVFITYYNISLRNEILHYLRRLQKYIPFSLSNISVYHYHHEQYLRRCGLSPSKKYDLILTDETQDFDRDMLADIEDWGNKNIYLADIEQDCYENNPLGQKTEDDIPAPYAPSPGRWNTLRSKSHRQNNRISRIADIFKAEVIGSGNYPDEDAYRNDSVIEYESDFQNKGLSNLVQDYLQGNEHIENTVILSSERNLLAEIYEQLKGHYRLMPTFDPQNPLDKNSRGNWDRPSRPFKFAFDAHSEMLKISTIKSFKGLEQDNVLLIIPPNIRTNKIENIQTYIGMTRAMKKLTIIDAARHYHDFFCKYQDLIS